MYWLRENMDTDEVDEVEVGMIEPKSHISLNVDEVC